MSYKLSHPNNGNGRRKKWYGISWSFLKTGQEPNVSTMIYTGGIYLVLRLFRDFCQGVSNNRGQPQLFHLQTEPLFLLTAYTTSKFTSIKAVPYSNYTAPPFHIWYKIRLHLLNDTVLSHVDAIFRTHAPLADGKKIRFLAGIWKGTRTA
jgi:hypothetical protein